MQIFQLSDCGWLFQTFSRIPNKVGGFSNTAEEKKTHQHFLLKHWYRKKIIFSMYSFFVIMYFYALLQNKE